MFALKSSNETKTRFPVLPQFLYTKVFRNITSSYECLGTCRMPAQSLITKLVLAKLRDSESTTPVEVLRTCAI